MCVNNVAVGLLLTTSSDFPLGSAASAAAEQPAQKELNRTDGSVAAWTNVERKVVRDPWRPMERDPLCSPGVLLLCCCLPAWPQAHHLP